MNRTHKLITNYKLTAAALWLSLCADNWCYHCIQWILWLSQIISVIHTKLNSCVSSWSSVCLYVTESRSWVWLIGHNKQPCMIIMYEKWIIRIAILLHNYMAAYRCFGSQEGSGQPGHNRHLWTLYTMNPWHLYSCCDYCCYWRGYNYPDAAHIADIKSDITTLMAIHTIVTLIIVQNQQFIILYSPNSQTFIVYTS